MRSPIPLLLSFLGPLLVLQGAPQQSQRLVGINVVLNTTPSNAILSSLATLGKVRDVVTTLNAITIQAEEGKLSIIRSLPFVLAADLDAARKGGPIATMPVPDFSDGLSTWDLDAMDVTNQGSGRTVDYDGDGVYVAVLDTGLVGLWTNYFPQERIATQYGIAFGGGGGEMGSVSSQPNKWEEDQDSHGTHVTSTILGYNSRGTLINGVAPKATVIPVKVLNQNGSGWSSVVARGISYVADLKAGPLAGHPVVINMSLGGPELDAMEKAAIDYAISKGAIVVASAGNEGSAGMGYPGAYAPVISVAASGWVGEWTNSRWWLGDVPETSLASNSYIAEFSSRQLRGQQLDVAAPGTWVVGPYQENSGQISFYYLGGTSMASPHVAGVVALMAQKNPALTAADAESALKSSATTLGAGCRSILDAPSSNPRQVCWGNDATGSGLVTADAALKATR